MTVPSAVSRGVPTNSWRNILPSEESYYRVRDQLTVVDGILMLDSLFIIPEALRRKVMVLSHEGHPGQDIFRETLRQRVWWPGLTKDATQFAEQCSMCWRRRNNPAQDLLPTEIEGVWDKLAVDIVTIDCHHLLSIIYYGSRVPELLDISSTTTSGVIDELVEVFARFGLPASLVSNNGPQFASSETAAFLKQLNIRHIKSSPRYPRSNGMVEGFHRLVRDRLAVLKPHLAFHRRLQQVLFDIRNSHHRMLVQRQTTLYSTVPCVAVYQHIFLHASWMPIIRSVPRWPWQQLMMHAVVYVLCRHCFPELGYQSGMVILMNVGCGQWCNNMVGRSASVTDARFCFETDSTSVSSNRRLSH